MGSWFDSVWIPNHPGELLRYASVSQNPPHGLLGVSREEYLSSLDEFRLGPGYAQLPPNPDVLSWLVAEGGRCRHVALTATPLRAVPATAAWVLRHFGRWIREFAFIPAERSGETLPTYDADKGEWLARHGGSSVLVDDSPQNIAAARAAGISTLSWPRPWNDGPPPAETLQALSRFVLTGEAS
jgi:FMN phosphatase YigB (HAD superfamily)